MDSNHRPSGYEPDELPLLHAASPTSKQITGASTSSPRESSPQYPRRCAVARPGSGWIGVVPARSRHTCAPGENARQAHTDSSISMLTITAPALHTHAGLSLTRQALGPQ